MIVVSDTSPIGSLFLINQLQILPLIFGKVIIPNQVYTELLILETLFAHDLSILKTASWLEIRQVGDHNAVQLLQQTLDKGEAEAIILAKEIDADFVLIDEQEGRRIAQAEGVRIIGLLGVLIQAKRQGGIAAVKPIMDNLRTIAKFRIAEPLYQSILKQVEE